VTGVKFSTLLEVCCQERHESSHLSHVNTSKMRDIGTWKVLSSTSAEICSSGGKRALVFPSSSRLSLGESRKYANSEHPFVGLLRVFPHVFNCKANFFQFVCIVNAALTLAASKILTTFCPSYVAFGNTVTSQHGKPRLLVGLPSDRGVSRESVSKFSQ